MSPNATLRRVLDALVAHDQQAAIDAMVELDLLLDQTPPQTPEWGTVLLGAVVSLGGRK